MPHSKSTGLVGPISSVDINVGYLWIVSVPVLFVLFIALLSALFSRFRQYIVVALLAVYGLYGLFESIGAPLGWTSIFPPALLAAAVGVALRTRWAHIWSMRSPGSS